MMQRRVPSPLSLLQNTSDLIEMTAALRDGSSTSSFMSKRPELTPKHFVRLPASLASDLYFAKEDLRRYPDDKALQERVDALQREADAHIARESQSLWPIAAAVGYQHVVRPAASVLRFIPDVVDRLASRSSTLQSNGDDARGWLSPSASQAAAALESYKRMRGY